MPDLDGGFFLMEKGIPGDQQIEGLQNATLQRVGPFEMSVAVWIEPPQTTIDRGEDAIAAWVSFLLGTWNRDAIMQGGVARFHVQIGPASQ